MATNYRILFENRHGVDANYSFFTQQPVVDGNASNPDCFTNVWIATLVPDSGNVIIATTSQYYAWTGKAATSPAPGVTISGGVGKPVELGTDTSPGSSWKMIDNSGTSEFTTEGATASSSCFEIDTGTDFQRSDNFLIGLGQLDSDGLVVPVATIPADQNMRTQIMPLVKFYVAKSSAVQGTVVDFQSVSATAGVIDFTSGDGIGHYGAHVIHNADGTFSTTYEVKKDFYMAAASLASGNSGLSSGQSALVQVQEQIQILAQTVASLLNPGQTATSPSWSYTGTVEWRNGVVTSELSSIESSLRSSYNIGTPANVPGSPNYRTLMFWPKGEPGSKPSTVPDGATNSWANALKFQTKDTINHGVAFTCRSNLFPNPNVLASQSY